jgi:16S rRNA (adenine1518-N6/adenine1519-N6)-dimethyltransferase
MPQHLGQNFLNNSTIADNILRLANLYPADTVLEIGPGKGILTQKLCATGAKVIAVELDEKLKENLTEIFKNTPNLTIIYADILKINLSQLFKEHQVGNYKLIANIPYYITSKIIRLFLETTQKPSEIILMVQKEVAQRIIAPAGKMSKLSVSVQYYAHAEILFDVPRENFSPAPQIDSCVIKISAIKSIDPLKSKEFFKVVRSGFCARRKTLLNNLANSLHIDKDILEKNFNVLGLSTQTRAQELSIDAWIKLSELITKKLISSK